MTLWPIFANRSPFALVILGLVAFVLNATLTALFPVTPAVHDEFSYLLAADTFRAGSLTLPSPAGAEHLVTPHVNVSPTRHTAYMPGHGMALAFGWQVFGAPIRGAWLLGALLSVAVAWALLGILPLRWALAGGALAAFHPGIAVYWNQTYFGGSLSACGGALILGALLRVVERPRLSAGMWLSVGMLSIVMSRPYVGFLSSIGVLFFLGRVWIRGTDESRQLLLNRVILPVVCVGILGGGCLLYYNRVLTGDPLQLPYALNAKAVGAYPNFIFQSSPPPVDRPDSIEAYQRLRAEDYYTKRSLGGFLTLSLTWIARLGRFYLVTGLLLVPLLGLLKAWRMRIVRRCVWLLMALGIAILPIKTVNPQYAAPAVVLVCLLVVVSARELLSMKRWRWALIPATPLLVASPFLVSIERQSRLVGEWFHRRAAIEESLSSSEGQHIVFVVYDETHDPLAEWVHNDADLARAKVVWARSLGAVKDRAFVADYPGRTEWYLRADVPSAELQR